MRRGRAECEADCDGNVSEECIFNTCADVRESSCGVAKDCGRRISVGEKDGVCKVGVGEVGGSLREMRKAAAGFRAAELRPVLSVMDRAARCLRDGAVGSSCRGDGVRFGLVLCFELEMGYICFRGCVCSRRRNESGDRATAADAPASA
jgi:hypothetical protein